jgi:DNA repair photolyase
MTKQDIEYREVEAKSLLRPAVLVDPWFLGQFGANLYRGCEHACAYCDGRAERYYVEGDFARDIAVKRNALELSRVELQKRREPGFLFVGGGVSDSYQPAEQKYQLARGLLEQALNNGLAVHVLTKSALVERDFDILQAVAKRTRAILSVSLQSLDDEVRARLEPNAATVAARLQLLERARARGIRTGIMAMPILPGISDSQAQIDALVRCARDVGAEFVCFGGLTLRPGRQKDCYYDALRAHWPHLVHGYDRAFASAKPSGAPDPRYNVKITQRFAVALAQSGLPSRIPRSIFAGIVPRYTEASVLLEHCEQAALLRGARKPLAKSGFALAQWAHQRVTAVCRRQGCSFRDVELEFGERLRDGSLAGVAGLTPEAVEQLRGLGFADATAALIP